MPNIRLALKEIHLINNQKINKTTKNYVTGNLTNYL